MTTPPGFGTVFPYLFVSDAAAYISFLTLALKAEEVGRTLRPDGKVANAQIRIGDTSFMVSEASDAYPPSRCALYLYVENADGAMEHALKHGAAHEMDVADMPYGDRQGGVRDPAGNVWWISQRLVEDPHYPTTD